MQYPMQFPAVAPAPRRLAMSVVVMRTLATIALASIAAPRPALALPLQSESDISKRTVEKFDPVRLLAGKAKDLKLSPKQRADLEALDVPIKWNMTKLAARIDSAQRDMSGTKSLGGRRGSSTDAIIERTPEEARAHIIADRKIILDALAELQREYDLRSAEALTLLSSEQRTTAAAILKKRQDELTKILDDAGWLTPLRAARGNGGRG